MTGFGSSEFVLGTIRYCVDVRSVNHRGLDIRVSTVPEFSSVEPAVRLAVKSRVARGSVSVSIRAVGRVVSDHDASVDEEACAQWLSLWKAAAALTGNERGAPPAEWLLDRPGVVATDSSTHTADEITAAAMPAVEAALESLVRMRQQEGAALVRDVVERLDRLDELVSALQASAPEGPKRFRERLERRLRDWDGGAQGSALHQRIEMEVVLLAERADIHEEIARIGAHTEHARELVWPTAGISAEGEPIRLGKRLSFLAAEMLREASTIAAKAHALETSSLALDARCEVERIKEQAVNFE